MIELILEAVRDRLRSLNGWTVHQCGLQVDATPPPTASQWYVAIDEDGVSADGQLENYWLKETSRIVVAVWRSCGEVPADMLGTLNLWEDRYRPLINSLAKLERKVIQGIHQRFEIMNAVNSVITSDQGTYGELMTETMFYRGRTKTEPFLEDQQGRRKLYVGRRLRFAGGGRTQSIENVR